MNHLDVISYEVAREDYFDAIEEGRHLLPEHKEELAIHKDIPLDPDYAAYEAVARAGLMALYTVRVEGKMVGYAVYFVRKHMHYQSASYAICDIILIKKGHRNLGLGTALFDFVEKDLAEQGVDVIHNGTKAGHPELAMLLESRKWVKSEIHYEKRLRHAR